MRHARVSHRDRGLRPVGGKAREGLRFRPRARLMTTLGRELISSDVVAITELVKNSYDADARVVLIRLTDEFDGLGPPGTSRIQILDDGHGMDEKTILETWLEPATSFRTKSQTTTGGRRVLGEKGVGRFAAAKLGDRLELISKAEGTGEVQLDIDWSAFDDDSKYLEDVEVSLDLVEHGDFGPDGFVFNIWDDAVPYLEATNRPMADHGTLLTISGLRSAWTSELIEELRRSLSRLITPFQDERKIVQDFAIILDTPGDMGRGTELISSPSTLQKPHYKLSAEVEEDGHATVLMELKDGIELEIDHTLKMVADRAHLTCGSFEVFLNVWDRDSDSLRPIAHEVGTLKLARETLDSAAGVNIYRDGFRVLPYGERGDDWLGLDRRRVQNPTLRLSNNQIVGYVLIGRDTNPELNDQSNREGIIDGPAFADLRKAVSEILSLIESERYKARRPRRETKRKRRGGLLDRFDLTVIREAVRQELPDDTRIRNLLDETQQEFDERIGEVGEVLARYHRLATLGQLVDKVVHDTAQPIVAIRQAAVLGERELEDIADEISSWVGAGPLQNPTKRFRTVSAQAKVANDVIRRIEPFGGRRRGKSQKYPIENAIMNAVALLQDEIDAVGAEIRMPEGAHDVTLDGTDLQEVLLNLMNNSLHWLKQVRRGSRVISLAVERSQDGSLVITVEDSGQGVPEGDREFIFDPYFTTKGDGVGLGLAIAGEIVEDYYGGELALLEPGELGGARFRVTLRRRVG